jgi:hypothetical protein
LVAVRTNAVGIRHGSLVGIVACGAGKSSMRFQKAGGLPETIRLADDFEFVVVARVRGVIEVLNVIAQRLTRMIRKNAAVELHDAARQFGAGGFEMALHAYVHLQIGREARRVNNGAANIVRGPALPHSFGVRGAGTVTALAVDAVRKLRGKHRSAFTFRIAPGDPWVCCGRTCIGRKPRG